MFFQSAHWTPQQAWTLPAAQPTSQPHLVWFFSSLPLPEAQKRVQELANAYPQAEIVGCSTAGEIVGEDLFEGSAHAVLVQWQQVQQRVVAVSLLDTTSALVGETLGQALQAPDLRAVLLWGPGVGINLSELIPALVAEIGSDIPISGGLSSDCFGRGDLWVAHQQHLSATQVVAVGLYGDSLRISHGCFGGWQTFGPERKVTKSSGNKLFELDQSPALDLYRRYLGDEAAQLPVSLLRFPLMLKTGAGVVRTLAALDEAEQSLTAFGNIPEGCTVQLMRGQFDSLIDGASQAAQQAMQRHAHSQPLALLVSCLGRRLVLGQRTAEELEAVKEHLPSDTVMTGFYSAGEIAPALAGGEHLHNQTMTLTLLSEVL